MITFSEDIRIISNGIECLWTVIEQYLICLMRFQFSDLFFIIIIMAMVI
jgi:hypothetical protein